MFYFGGIATIDCLHRALAFLTIRNHIRDALLGLSRRCSVRMMLKTQRSQQRVALMILMVVAAVHCQENERRAVTEHQLMHDRGRSIQSLKRLIWLSSAIEGLHTAQTRTLTADEPDSRWRSRDPAQLYSQPGKDSGISGHKRALETLLSDMYRPHLTAALGDGKK
ncbi:hypothetical protein Q8A67_005488 [Cirrhinus molitorella]|uniref:Parathyroid hormone-related protein n=1 Tax=Cirrhinus molitorella TaxID=172907 RepID=A0AA88TSP1_9TELE|nr:hypothetical protein Q8A67_005488 [Cirrhinus molitorella]